MKYLYSLLFLFLFLFQLHAQDRVDGSFVVSVSDIDAVDLQCDLYQNIPSVEDIQSLMDNGRYLISVNRTKFGTIVLHKKNIMNIKQLFVTKIYSINLKKELKKMQKEDLVLLFFNSELDCAIFEHNPNVTEQVIVDLKINKEKCIKQLSKLNSKGLHITILTSMGRGVAQNINHDSPIEQLCETYSDEKRIKSIYKDLSGIQDRLSEGWIVKSVYKYYNHYSNYNSYHVLFERSLGSSKNNFQDVKIISTQEDFGELLANQMLAGYTIDNIWCGWDGKKEEDYEASKRNASYNSMNSLFDALVGVTSTVTSIIGMGDNDNSDSGVTNSSVESNANNKTGYSRQNSSQAKQVNLANWRTLERTYSGYEDQLIKMQSSGNYDKQEVRNIQQKMKDIRKKIGEQSGHNRAVSPLESWNP